MPTFIHKPPKKGKNESDSAMKKKNEEKKLPPIKVHVFCKDKQTKTNQGQN